MHVCFVSPKIYNYLGTGAERNAGGAERQQYLLACELRDRGHDVSLLTRQYGGARCERREGLDVWKYVPDVRGATGAPVKASLVWYALARIGADAYYVRGNDFLSMAVAPYCRATDAAFVFAVSSDADVEPAYLSRYHPLRRRAYVASIRAADAVASQTDHQRRVLAEVHGIDSTVLANGYDLPPEETVLAHDDREFVLWVGRMARDQKRPELYLDLARSLPSVSFVMVGPPNDDEEAYFEEVRAEASGVDNLRFEGFVRPDEMNAYYRRAIALVNTSTYEGLPNVFLEAWRYATPVVSLEYDLDGDLDSEPIGVRSGSMDRLVKDVASLASNADRRAELGWGGRRYLDQHYSLCRLADRYEDLFAGVVGD
ncbi:MAG: glycosyltransferase family 4 protein [Haloplanus sp.]